MRDLLIVFFLTILSFSTVLSQSLAETKVNVFGEVLSTGEPTERASFMGQLDSQDTVRVKLKGVITEVCQSKGCWMKVDIGGGEIMRVTFKDYGFFVPKDATGASVIFEGDGFKKVTSVEELKHYKKDSGGTDEEVERIVTPKEELGFVAKGVGIIN